MKTALKHINEHHFRRTIQSTTVCHYRVSLPCPDSFIASASGPVIRVHREQWYTRSSGISGISEASYLSPRSHSFTVSASERTWEEKEEEEERM